MLDDIFKPRREWPFKDMDVGVVKRFYSSDTDLECARNAAKSYGHSAGKKFITRKVDDVLYVKRVA